MAILKECPFCGGSAALKDVIITKGSNYTGNIPEGSILVRVTETNMPRRPKIYWHEKHGFSVNCNTSGCICRNSATKFKTEQAAIDAWNTRFSKEETNEKV